MSELSTTRSRLQNGTMFEWWTPRRDSQGGVMDGITVASIWFPTPPSDRSWPSAFRVALHESPSRGPWFNIIDRT